MFEKMPVGKAKAFFIFVLLIIIIFFIFKKDLFYNTPIYLQTSFSIDERVEDLLSQMTLQEKIGQMTLVEKNSIEDIKDVHKYGLGAILSGFGGKPEDNTIKGWKNMVSDFIKESKKTRLSIPILYGVDAIHGHSNVPGATVFPHFIGLGATRDEGLVEEIAQVTAKEMIATGVNWSFSPTLDLPRDIRWGRTYETFSDDPELVSKFGVAYLNGLQKTNENEEYPEENHNIFILATAKHFVGLGSMVWGTSINDDYEIDQGTTLVDEDALRNEYLIPFKDAVSAGVQSVMIGLNTWDDLKLSENKYLITDVLKQELGFNGFAVSDWYGVYNISDDSYVSTVTAINAGIDMVMLPFDYKTFTEDMENAVEKGDIKEERIDDAVRRILRAKFALGLFDSDKDKISSKTIGSLEHRELAREAVSKSMVLLKNEDGVLPIKEDVKHIRVAGSAADNVGIQSGAWTLEWQGIDGNWLLGSTSILEGLRLRAGPGVEVEYEINGNFSKDNIADIGIAIVGEKPYAEGVGDKEYPTFDNSDLEAIKRLQEKSKKVVVLIVSGRPLFIEDEISSLDALVALWLPGSEGPGVADVIFGDKPFTGVLPIPWPSHIEQLPITPDGKTADGTKLLFPRYWGLDK